MVDKYMKILIDDGMQIKVGTGIGKYSEYLYNSLKSLRNNVITLDNFRGNKFKAMGRLMYLRYINSYKYLKSLSDYDVVHYTNYAMPLIKNPEVKYVVTIHDLASFICPETLPKAYQIYSRFVIKHALQRADAIVTVSNSVKCEIEQYFPDYADKVKVVYPGIYSEIVPISKSGRYENEKLRDLLKRKFFLFVGTIEKRKNIGIIIEAFVALKKKFAEAVDYKLVLAGRPGFGYNDYFNLVKNSGFEKDIIFTGYISKDDCNKLYNEASAYVFPSIYEGFGSIQTECMRCHLPLILSDIKTNREVSRNFGEFFSLDNADELTQKMLLLVLGKYDYKGKFEVADRYIQEFNWGNIAREYNKIYEELRK